MKSFSERLSFVMRTQGMRTEDFDATRLISSETVSNYLKEKFEPEPPMFLNLCKALKLEPEQRELLVEPLLHTTPDDFLWHMRKQRFLLGYNLETLANRSGVNQRTLERFERSGGVGRSHAFIVKRLCDGLQMKPEQRAAALWTLISEPQASFLGKLKFYQLREGMSPTELMKAAHISAGYFRPIWEGQELPDEWHFWYLSEALHLSREERADLVCGLLGGRPDPKHSGSLLTHYRWRQGWTRNQMESMLSRVTGSWLEYTFMERDGAPFTPEVLSFLSEKLELEPAEQRQLAKAAGIHAPRKPGGKKSGEQAAQIPGCTVQAAHATHALLSYGRGGKIR